MLPYRLLSIFSNNLITNAIWFSIFLISCVLTVIITKIIVIKRKHKLEFKRKLTEKLNAKSAKDNLFARVDANHKAKRELAERIAKEETEAKKIAKIASDNAAKKAKYEADARAELDAASKLKAKITLDNIAKKEKEVADARAEALAAANKIAKIALDYAAKKAKEEADAKLEAEIQKLKEDKDLTLQVRIKNHLAESLAARDKIINPPTKLIQKPNAQIARKTTNPYIDSNVVQINVIISVPESDTKVPKRIGYKPNEKFSQRDPYNYAVVKMPSQNSFIKFPRKGRSDKKGYKEDEFLTHLNTYFKTTFNIFNDRHIPTENGRPYEPDFVICSEKDNKNIFINIEIDEPYDGLTRTPTHSIGDNDFRDDFFTKGGWIVIRFAEIQIHLEPKNCCAYIAKVIKSIDISFNSELLTVSIPNQVLQWNNLQSQKWSKQKYREEYLGITNFGNRSNIITEYEIFESEADRVIEKEVPKNKKISTLESGNLATKNKVNRDSRIKFDQVKHRYYIDENPDTISVTQLIDRFFPEFDSPYKSRRKAIERLFSLGIEQLEENILQMQNTILKEWEDKRNVTANKGKALHEAIENYYNQKSYESDTNEFQKFLTFKQRYQNMIPYRSGWRIFDEDLLVAGTIDMVYKKEDDSLYMFDWKRSEKVVNFDGTIKNDTFNFAFGELGHLGDNRFNKYCLQQNIYKAILEKRYGQRISSMNLLVLHETYDRYHHIPIPNMESEVRHIFSYAQLIK